MRIPQVVISALLMILTAQPAAAGPYFCSGLESLTGLCNQNEIAKNLNGLRENLSARLGFTPSEATMELVGEVLQPGFGLKKSVCRIEIEKSGVTPALDFRVATPERAHLQNFGFPVYNNLGAKPVVWKNDRISLVTQDLIGNQYELDFRGNASTPMRMTFGFRSERWARIHLESLTCVNLKVVKRTP